MKSAHSSGSAEGVETTTVQLVSESNHLIPSSSGVVKSVRFTLSRGTVIFVPSFGQCDQIVGNSRLPGRYSHAVYVNTQALSIALFKTVIPASEPILSGEDSLDRLRCLRKLTREIAGLLSHSSITADKRGLSQAFANSFTKLTSMHCVAVS